MYEGLWTSAPRGHHGLAQGEGLTGHHAEGLHVAVHHHDPGAGHAFQHVGVGATAVEGDLLPEAQVLGQPFEHVPVRTVTDQVQVQDQTPVPQQGQRAQHAAHVLGAVHQVGHHHQAIGRATRGKWHLFHRQHVGHHLEACIEPMLDEGPAQVIGHGDGARGILHLPPGEALHPVGFPLPGAVEVLAALLGDEVGPAFPPGQGACQPDRPHEDVRMEQVGHAPFPLHPRPTAQGRSPVTHEVHGPLQPGVVGPEGLVVAAQLPDPIGLGHLLMLAFPQPDDRVYEQHAHPHLPPHGQRLFPDEVAQLGVVPARIPLGDEQHVHAARKVSRGPAAGGRQGVVGAEGRVYLQACSGRVTFPDAHGGCSSVG